MAKKLRKNLAGVTLVSGTGFVNLSNMKKLSIQEIAKKNRDRLANNPTKAEVKFMAILRQLEIPFRFQFIIWNKTSFFIADFVVTNKKGKKYVLEADGGYHFNYKQKKSDKNRSSKIRLKSSYGVLRFKNQTILKEPQKVIAKLKRYEII